MCVDHTDVPVKTTKPIEMPFGGLTQVGPSNHVLDVGRDILREGEFWGVVRPTEKHWESLLRCMQQKRRFNRQ